jgi:hypothetical protein
LARDLSLRRPIRLAMASNARYTQPLFKR